ncbi:MAG TPA: 2-amino-4-hydroxy-6-hydroxymethyldihydropteridine diphosphokinase [Actinomycetota bacterium]|nr:2-amino-4-hydroxy-6-hydroxymethyldihydropteridine diphosphokinase [Actinomycetota bacterium]
MTVAYIGIGSNVGDRVAFARRGVDELGASDDVQVSRVSSLYETSPLGGPPQRSYVNLVTEVETTLSPQELLQVAKAIETKLGRESNAMRWGPRVVDLDILLFGEEKVNDPDLEIPHPRLRERRFALIPLLEVAPDAADPWGARYADVVSEAQGEVELLEPWLLESREPTT